MARSRIGPLALEAPLGKSGSNIFRAIHVQQRAQLAVRVFSLPMGMTPEAKQEFSNQLESLKSLKHPNIVRCYGGGFDAKDAYLVYELVEGESLEKMIEKRNRLPWETVLDYGLQLCEALQMAHSTGWLHTRLRPDKILVSPDGLVVKLNDFRRSPANFAPPTPQHLAYTAPEALTEPHQAEAAMDLYSLGATMYYALTGTVPFLSENATLTRRAIQETVLPSVTSLVFDCPIWLSAIIDDLLMKDPVRRPFTAVAVSMALREAQKRELQGIGVAEHAVSGFSPLKLNVDKAEAEKALGHSKRKKRYRPEDDGEYQDSPGLLERPLVLLGLLGLIICVITYFVWPLDERGLRDRAIALMKTDESVAWNDARDKYLEPMLERFPDGRYAEWAQEQLELIEMRNAEDQMRRNSILDRQPSSEGERRYREALRFENYGDRVTALEKYRGIVNLLKTETKERPWVNLSRRKIANIESNPPSAEELRKFLKEKLADAERMYSEGDVTGAKQIWDGIISLYNGNQEMLPFVEQAQGKLERLKSL